VPDQGDPPLDPAAPWPPFDDSTLRSQNVRHGAGVGHVRYIPAPLSDGSPRPRRLERGGESFRIGDGAGLHHGRGAVAQALQRRQGRSHLVVLGAVVLMDRHRPPVDRLIGRDVVRYAARDQGVAGEVLMRVDETRGYNTTRCIENLGVWVASSDDIGRADFDDELPVNQDRSVDQYLTTRIHRHDVAAGNDQLTHNPTQKRELSPKIAPLGAEIGDSSRGLATLALVRERVPVVGAAHEQTILDNDAHDAPDVYWMSVVRGGHSVGGHRPFAGLDDVLDLVSEAVEHGQESRQTFSIDVPADRSRPEGARVFVDEPVRDVAADRVSRTCLER